MLKEREKKKEMMKEREKKRDAERESERKKRYDERERVRGCEIQKEIPS